MRWVLGAAAASVMLPISVDAVSRPILYDAVALNIGVNCQWQSQCMSEQRKAMKRALSYVADHDPPRWRVELCNRNAGRSGYRVDWVGYDHCIRNASLKPLPRKRSH
jgi:hypothetical protein